MPKHKLKESKQHRTRKALLITLALTTVALLVFGVIKYFGFFQSPPGSTGRVNVSSSPEKPTSVPYVIQEVVGNLSVPWSIVFTGSDRILVAERNGKVRIVQNNKLANEPLITFPEVSSKAEEGLMGLVLDPNYNRNKYIYACLAYDTTKGLQDKVVRFKDNGSSASEITTILEGIPAAQYHAGCKLKFGPDNKLYITTGDATNKTIAQDLNSLGGKILRINADGTIPIDNPTKDSPVWSYGHRNAQGLCWQSSTNQLFSVEHGPSGFDGPGGGDEVNIIYKGGNYGWPLVSHEGKKEGTIAPLLVFTPAVAPAACSFYSSANLPQFKGDLFFAGLKGEGLWRVRFVEGDPSQVASFEKMADINMGRLREVIEGPDGNLYFTTSNRDGRGKVQPGDDKIMVIKPQ